MKKKLIEVALPLEEINKSTAAERNIHTGMPANLHTWWSRKPLGAARAILFASLVDDPSNYLPENEANIERSRLFTLIEKLSDPKNLHNMEVIQAARNEIRKSSNGDNIVFYDPFSGGGSLPLEAQRLGLKAHASDLNPVSVLISKALIDIPQKVVNKQPVNKYTSTFKDEEWRGLTGFIEDIKAYGKWIENKAKEKLKLLYPNGPKGEKIVSWIWARTVKCPNPACEATMPLVNKFWVSTHKGNEAWVEPIINQETRIVSFEIRTGNGNPPSGTVNKKGAQCIVCKGHVPFEYIRSEGREGRMGTQLMCYVVEGPKGRVYLSPDEMQIQTAGSAKTNWEPETELPSQALGFRVQNYGITKHRDLFTARQLVSLTTFSDLVREVREKILIDSSGDIEYTDAITVFLSLSLNRLAQTNNTLIRWLVRKTGTSKGTPAFDRQIVSMVWEFSEGNVFGESVGSWSTALNNPITALKSIPWENCIAGEVWQCDAASNYKIEKPVISTDPPYYDNIGYSDLSDFYYIWFRKTLKNIYPELFNTILVPKKDELVAGSHLFGGDKNAASKNFLERLKSAFQQMCNKSHQDYPVTIYYAFKQSDEVYEEDESRTAISTGWQTMLEALIDAGFMVTATWPLRTEQTKRLRALGSNALASSIVFACRKRAEEAAIATRREFIIALKRELNVSIKNLQMVHTAPVDLAQAAIGPGISVFSQYKAVLESNGKPMTVQTALALINQASDEIINLEESEFDSQTRWAITWYEDNGYSESLFGDAEALTKAKNTSIGKLERQGIISAKAGKVRLLTREEIYNLDILKMENSIWLVVQRLAVILSRDGENGAAKELAKYISYSDVARDLVYLLFRIAERKGWTEDALAYNSLIVAWSQMSNIAEDMAAFFVNEQQSMF
ncbi:DUF1156 domain-containing protein [Neobacillus sp. YIM B06451]|uniref:DUF1156 domain-containing protein n=1 Tax=Neobacillus sp. YIM B06451 TaxID=3070994 RepID=UPI00292E2444|nr:DUF1156 domain-containing protein [Neobacillus sp. YIM B06451]